MEYHLARSLVRWGTAAERKKSRGQIFGDDRTERAAVSVARVSRSAKATRNHRRRKKEDEKRSLAVVYVDDCYARLRLDFKSASSYFNRYLAATSTLGSGAGSSIENFQRIVKLACRDRRRRKRRPGSRGENDRWE